MTSARRSLGDPNRETMVQPRASASRCGTAGSASSRARRDHRCDHGLSSIPNESLGRKGARGRAGGPIRFQVRFPTPLRHARSQRNDEALRAVRRGASANELELDGIYARFDSRAGMVMLVEARRLAEAARRVARGRSARRCRRSRACGPASKRSARKGRRASRSKARTRVCSKRRWSASKRGSSRCLRSPRPRANRRPRSRSCASKSTAKPVRRGIIEPSRIRGMMGWVVRGARLRDYRARGTTLPLLIELDPEQAVEVGNLRELLITHRPRHEAALRALADERAQRRRDHRTPRRPPRRGDDGREQRAKDDKIVSRRRSANAGEHEAAAGHSLPGRRELARLPTQRRRDGYGPALGRGVRIPSDRRAVRIGACCRSR